MQPAEDQPVEELQHIPTQRPPGETDLAEPTPAFDGETEPTPAFDGETEPVLDGEPEPVAGLSEREEQILTFEAKWWRHAGAKEQAIRDSFGLSSTRYYQLLNTLLDNPAALERDPVLVGRLRRLRSARARTRRR
ncbi:DUF3263 domain-containing protein [Actinoplanes sp. NPDC051851]|uniref:DUF3263 domain-containing protein n=1 Tax=Actinoplanes sp. NPDC051851 TaxID=3154753 RepID=UPI00342FBBE4